MKLNIKGLVFVGFAAAILAGAARAEDEPPASSKTVTSKQYVDAKIVGQGDATGSIFSSESVDNKAPSAKAVYTAMDKQGSSTTSIFSANSADNMVPTSKAVYTALSAIDGTEYTGGNGIDITGHVVSADLVGSGNTTVTVGTGTDTNNGGNGIAAGKIQIKSPTFTQNGTEVSPNNGVVAFTDTTYDVFTGATAADGQNPAAAGSNGLVPGPEIGDDGNNFLRSDGSWQDIATTDTTYTFQSGTTAGKFQVKDNDDTTWTDVEVYHAQTTDNLSSSISTDTGSTTKYPSVKAVEDYVGVSIPAPTSGTCGTGAPCALVIENGTVSWEPIQQ